MKRSLALILTVMMVLCMIPASLLSALANGPGVGRTQGIDNLGYQTGFTTPIQKTVSVDGVLNDTGWDAESWLKVSSATGTWSVVAPQNDSFEYEYQLHKNETFFYGAYSVNRSSIFNGDLSEITVWINDDTVSDKYTQKIVINNFTFTVNEETGKTISATADMKAYNGTTEVSDPTDLSKETLDLDDYYTVSDASKHAVNIKEFDGDEMVVVEFRVRLDNFGSDFRLNDKLTTFSQVKVADDTDGTYSESLYFPYISTTADRVLSESPDSFWPEDAHVITKSDISNTDGMADYNNVLPTDINVDGRFTEGLWVHLTDRYTSINPKSKAGFTIDDYRREEDYDEGYIANLNHSVSTNHYEKDYNDPASTIAENKLRFKYDIVINDGYVSGAVVAFADSTYATASKPLYLYVLLSNKGNGNACGLLEISLAGTTSNFEYYRGKSDLMDETTPTKMNTGDVVYGAAKRQKISHYLVNYEFRIPVGSISEYDYNCTDYSNTNDAAMGYCLMLSDTEFAKKQVSSTTSSYWTNVYGSGRNGNIATSGAFKKIPINTKNIEDAEINGDLNPTCWQNLIAADSFIDGMGTYGYEIDLEKIDASKVSSYIRQNTTYYYELRSDHDYVYGAAIIHDSTGWTTDDTFTVFVYNNTPENNQWYNFAISFNLTDMTKSVFTSQNTNWEVLGWYKNLPSGSPLKSGYNVYQKGNEAIAGIEAVMRVVGGESLNIDSFYGKTTDNKNTAVVLEFKIPTSLLFMDQTWGADPYSNAVAFGYYTSVHKRSYNGNNSGYIPNDDGHNKSSLVHPFAYNQGAGLEHDDKDDIQHEFTYNEETGEYVQGGKTALVNPLGTTVAPECREVNYRLFDPRRIAKVEIMRLRSDTWDDGLWDHGRNVDNFKPDGKLEEVFWNQEEELIAVNGETGLWSALPTTNGTLDYGYRVFTGREYVYGGVKINAAATEGTKFTIWFNSVEGTTAGNSNATHRFTFYLEPNSDGYYEVAKCEATNLVNGLDIPISGTVIEDGYATSGTLEQYVLFDMKTINEETVLDFMIDIDLLNINNTKTGAIDHARNGYEYVVAVTQPVDGESLTLYHTENSQKNFWVTGYGDSVPTDVSSAGLIITEMPTEANKIEVTAVSDIVVFEPTEYEDVYTIKKVIYGKDHNAGRGGTNLYGLLTGNSVTSIPENGFVYVFHRGTASADSKFVHDNQTSYASSTAYNANLYTDFINTSKEGSYIKIEGLSLKNDGSHTWNQSTYTYSAWGVEENNVVQGKYDETTLAKTKLAAYATGYISRPQYTTFDLETADDVIVADNFFDSSFGNCAPALKVSYLGDYVTEKIYIDGKFDDTGWDENGWIVVNETVNANRQTIHHTSGEKNVDGTYDNEFQSFKYQVRNDGEYFYVAAEIFMPMDGTYSDGTILVDANGKGGAVYPTFRLWTNDGSTTTYTKLFDLEAAPRNEHMSLDVLGNSYVKVDFNELDIDSRTRYDADAYKASNSTTAINENTGTPLVVADNGSIVSHGDGTYTLIYGRETYTDDDGNKINPTKLKWKTWWTDSPKDYEDYRGTYNVRVTETLEQFAHNPNAGSEDTAYGSVAVQQKLGYTDSSFYGETVVLEENAYRGYDYDDTTDVGTDANGNVTGDSWVAERHLQRITYGSEHAVMMDSGHDTTLVEYKIKLSEIAADDGTFEYGFHCSAMGIGDSGNDYLFFYPMVVKEVGQDISKFDRFHMPMWYWSNTALVANDEFFRDTMLKSTYTPVTEIGAQAFIDTYPSNIYGINTSAVKLGAYYDHDYIRRFMRDKGVYNYNDWDYWDVYEMGVLIFPAHSMLEKIPVLDENGDPVLDEDGNPTYVTSTNSNGETVYVQQQVDHDEFLTVTAEDRYYKLSKGVRNIEADNIDRHMGDGSRFCDYENFVFYAAMVLSNAQNTGANKNKLLNMKYSYRGYIDFYGNDLYNDEFEGSPSEMDAFLQYYYNQSENYIDGKFSSDNLYKEGTFTTGIRGDIYSNPSDKGNGLVFGGKGFDADVAVKNTGNEIKLPNIENVTNSSVVGLAEIREYSLKDKALYSDYYSNSMIRSIWLVKEIEEHVKNAGGGSNNTDNEKVDDTKAGVYYVPANWSEMGDARATYLANSVGYSLVYPSSDASDIAAAKRAVVYVGDEIDNGENGNAVAGVSVADAINLAKTKNVVAVTTTAATKTAIDTAVAEWNAANANNKVSIDVIVNSDPDVLGLLGLAAVTSIGYKMNGAINVDVDYYGTANAIKNAKDIVNPMLEAVGARNNNTEGGLNILVLASVAGAVENSADSVDNLLAKAKDNLAENTPTVVIDMTGGEKLSGIADAMHLARLLGFSQNPVATEAAAIAISQGIARYVFLANSSNITDTSNQMFVKALTYHLVNDIAYGVDYAAAGAYTAVDVSTMPTNGSDEDTRIKTALKTQAFQNKAEKIVNQINGSGVLTALGTSSNINQCILVGTLKSTNTADDALFEMMFTSGINVARQNYEEKLNGATYSNPAGTDTLKGYANFAKVNGAGVLTDGETTTKIVDYLLPDVLELNTGATEYMTGTIYKWSPNEVINTGKEMSTASPPADWVENNLNVTQGILTENRWFAVPLKYGGKHSGNYAGENNPVGFSNEFTLNLSTAQDLSAVRLHLGNSSTANIYAYDPTITLSYSTDNGNTYTTFNTAFKTISSADYTGLKNYTYWSTLNLGGLKGVTNLKFTVGQYNAWGALIDEVEVYSEPSVVTDKVAIEVGTFNVGHAENAILAGAKTNADGTTTNIVEKAFGLRYSEDPNNGWANCGTIWGMGTRTHSSVDAVTKISAFLSATAFSHLDVIFLQEVTQYVGFYKNGQCWGNMNMIKKLAEGSGYEYYTYASGGSDGYQHGAENRVTDDPNTDIDNPSGGNGIISKHPIVASGTYKQTNGQVISWARLNVKGVFVDVYSTHFDGNSGKTFAKVMARNELFAGLSRVVENNEAYIIGADFNEAYTYTYMVKNDAWNQAIGLEAYQGHQTGDWKQQTEETIKTWTGDNFNEKTFGVKDVTALNTGYITLYSSGGEKCVDNILYGGLVTGTGENPYIGYPCTYSSGTFTDSNGQTLSYKFDDDDHNMVCFNVKLNP